MNRIANLHNKTCDVDVTDQPFNPENKLLSETDLREIFDSNGLSGVPFNNINIYRCAFVHRSYTVMRNDDMQTGNENLPADCLPLQVASYERLEFVGDAILSACVSRYLFDRFPDQNEGFLSKIRTRIVNGKMLGSLAGKLGFGRFMIISKQLENLQSRENPKILEDCFEAFIAAIYQDFQQPADFTPLPDHLKALSPLTGAGYYMAESFIISVIEKYIDFAELVLARNNYKDLLVRHMQNTLQDIPRFYEMDVTTTANGKKIFTYCVKDRSGAIIGRGKGESKKSAENIASKASLEYYGVAID